MIDSITPPNPVFEFRENEAMRTNVYSVTTHHPELRAIAADLHFLRTTLRASYDHEHVSEACTQLIEMSMSRVGELLLRAIYCKTPVHDGLTFDVITTEEGDLSLVFPEDLADRSSS